MMFSCTKRSEAMTQDVLQQYSAAAELLDAQEVMATPAELHGVLCGRWCRGAPMRRDAWLQEFNELVNDGASLRGAVNAWLESMFNATLEGLTLQAGFQLLLPEDDETLEDRLLAMSDWAQAFLAGFAVIQRDLTRASDELQEMLSDISEITQMEQELEDDGETEASYLVIYEHLKLGAMMAFEEFGQRPAELVSKPLH